MARPLVLAVFTMLGALAVLAPGRASTEQQAPQSPERAKLLELQRDAVGHLRQAAREGAPIEEVRRALADARRDLEALAAEPDRRDAVKPDRRDTAEPAPATL